MSFDVGQPSAPSEPEELFIGKRFKKIFLLTSAPGKRNTDDEYYWFEGVVRKLLPNGDIRVQYDADNKFEVISKDVYNNPAVFEWLGHTPKTALMEGARDALVNKPKMHQKTAPMLRLLKATRDDMDSQMKEIVGKRFLYKEESRGREYERPGTITEAKREFTREEDGYVMATLDATNGHARKSIKLNLDVINDPKVFNFIDAAGNKIPNQHFFFGCRKTML